MGNPGKTVKLVNEMESIEKDVCNLPLVFSDMFKNEINANDERKLYNGVKRIIKKYAQEGDAIEIINEFTRVISGGASLEEILLISKDEAMNPSLASAISVDDSCDLERKH